MKITKIIMNLILMLAISGSLVAQQNKVTDPQLKKEFENNIELWKQAYNSGDAQNLVPLYTEDAIYTSSHVAGLEAIGRDKLIANFQNGITMGGHLDAIEILSADVSCEMAYLFCKYQATNAGEKFTGRNLLVLKKVENKWMIVIHMTVV